MSYSKKPRYRSAAERKAKCHDCGKIGHYQKFCYVGRNSNRGRLNNTRY